MTSGQFRSVDINLINVNRGDRQRKSLEDLEGLAASLRTLGQIHPILIQRDSYELIAGERRLAAAKLLGWTHIMAQFEDELDTVELKILELEENTRRADLSWQEQCLAVDEYHSLMVQRDATWTQAATAHSLIMSDASVTQKLAVAKEIKAGNTIVAQAPKFSTARGIVERSESRKGNQLLTQIMEMEGGQAVPKRQELVVHADFRTWWPVYDGPKFNLIHCDFPYGADASNRQQGYNQHEFGSYSDSADDYWSLCRSLAESLEHIAEPSCHIIFWFWMKYYAETLDFFRKATPFKIDPFPLVWVKSDNVGLLPDPERGPRRIYETALFGAMGDRKIVRATSNAIATPSVRDSHMSEKSQTALEYFMRMFVDGSTSMLDPTAGSGSALRAARALGAAHVQGVEMNKEFAQRANERLAGA